MASTYSCFTVDKFTLFPLICRPCEGPVSIVVMRSLTEALPENRY